MKALVINCTLKPTPAPSNTEALAAVVVAEYARRGVPSEVVRAVDLQLTPGVERDMGGDDQWQTVHEQILASEILIIASPTWLGRPSSAAQRVLEQMDSMLGETDDAGRPVAFNRVAGIVVTGNEDGGHHVISEISGALVDIGFTVPGQSWTYWHLGPGPDFLDDERGHDWARSTGKAMAANLIGVAEALSVRPLGPPPS